MQENETLNQRTLNPGSGSTAWKTLSIISVVFGGIAFLFSFIPCLGVYAIFPGILALVLGIIGLVLAGKVNAPKTLPIIGIVCAVIGSSIAGYQSYKISKAVNDPEFKKQIKNVLDSATRSNKDLFDSIEVK
jgi:membrane-bound ClpP family serine protease